MSKVLNVGLVGLGRLGSLYAQYFTTRIPGSRLYAVSDVRPEAVTAVTTAYGVKGYNDYQALVNDSWRGCRRGNEPHEAALRSLHSGKVESVS